MKLEYTLSLADFQAAQSLHWHQTLARRVIHFSIYAGVPCLTAAIGSVLAKRVGILGQESPYWFQFLFGLVVASAYLTATVKGRKSKRFKKHFERRVPPNKRRSWIEVNDLGVTSAIVGTEPESYEWSTLFGFAQDEKITLIYIATKRFLFFPTQAMSPAQRAELNDLVARHVTPRTP